MWKEGGEMEAYAGEDAGHIQDLGVEVRMDAMVELILEDEMRTLTPAKGSSRAAPAGDGVEEFHLLLAAPPSRPQKLELGNPPRLALTMIRDIMMLGRSIISSDPE